MSSRRLALAALTLVLAWLVARGGSGPVLQALAYLLPAVLLLGTLWAKRYPGERVLLAAIDSFTPAPGADVGIDAQESGPPRARRPRGGRLIAFSLAVRPPPAAGALTI